MVLVFLSGAMLFHQSPNIDFIDLWFASRHYQMEENEEIGQYDPIVHVEMLHRHQLQDITRKL